MGGAWHRLSQRTTSSASSSMSSAEQRHCSLTHRMVPAVDLESTSSTTSVYFSIDLTSSRSTWPRRELDGIVDPVDSRRCTTG